MQSLFALLPLDLLPLRGAAAGAAC